MKRFTTIVSSLLLSPLWLMGYFAQVAWSILASGWIVSEEDMMKIYKERKEKP